MRQLAWPFFLYYSSQSVLCVFGFMYWALSKVNTTGALLIGRFKRASEVYEARALAFLINKTGRLKVIWLVPVSHP